MKKKSGGRRRPVDLFVTTMEEMRPLLEFHSLQLDNYQNEFWILRGDHVECHGPTFRFRLRNEQSGGDVR